MAQLRAILAVAACSLLACHAETQSNSTVLFLSNAASKGEPEGASISLDAQASADSIIDFDRRQAQKALDAAINFFATTGDQWAVGIGAFVAGAFMVNNGEASFMYVVVVATFFFVATSTYYEVDQVWNQEAGKLRLVIALEAAALLSYVVYAGYEGVKLLMGAALGIAITLKALDQVGQVTPVMQASIVTLCVGFGVYSFSKKQHTLWMGIIVPFIGGFLVSSSIGFGLAVYVRDNQTDLVDQGFKIDVKGDTVFEFMKALVVTDYPHVGITGAYTSPKFNGKEIDMDKVAGLALWFFTFLIGVQKHLNKRRMEEKSSTLLVPLLS